MQELWVLKDLTSCKQRYLTNLQIQTPLELNLYLRKDFKL